MTQSKLFEVTLRYFICAGDKKQAEDEMMRMFGSNYTSIYLKEIKAGFTAVQPEQELQPDEIPY